MLLTFPLSQTVTRPRTPSHTLERDVLYGRPLNGFFTHAQSIEWPMAMRGATVVTKGLQGLSRLRLRFFPDCVGFPRISVPPKGLFPLLSTPAHTRTVIVV